MDGVVLVGEHGSYHRNDMGQTEYPRYQFFEQIVDVFISNRTVPLFSDKHLSWRWDWAKQMYGTYVALYEFSFSGRLSLAVTWRIPSIEMPLGSQIQEALCICYGGVDSYDFHGLETIQCMVERRRGGESGVRWLHAYRGDRFWQRLKTMCGRRI